MHLLTDMLSLFTLQLSLLLDSSPSFSAQFTACYKILMVSYYNPVQHSVTQSSRLLEQALGTAGILTADYKNKKEHHPDKQIVVDMRIITYLEALLLGNCYSTVGQAYKSPPWFPQRWLLQTSM